MHSHRGKIWTVLVIAVTLLVVLSVLPIGQPSAVRAAGRTPAGLQDYEMWFGSQHTHIGMDGDDGASGSTAATGFAYAKNVPFLKYYIITPHVHAGRTVGDTTLYSDATYNTIRSQADSATTADFVAIAGQEVSTISSGGHWNLYNARAMVGRDHPDGDWTDSDSYYTHVAGLGTAGEDVAAQFNHATTGDFGNRYVAAAAPYFGTFAVSSGYTGATCQNFCENGSNLEYATNNPFENLWAHYMSLGWKLSPAADQDNHKATWGASSTEYTVIVRPKGTVLSRANVLQGLRQHMTYATEDANMQIGFVANGWSMGQTIGGPSNVSFTIWWNNPSTSVCNNNVPVCVTEPANDAIQNIWIYKNSFGTTGTSVGSSAGNYVARYQPNTASGTWNVTLAANTGDWFVVKFQDTFTFPTDPTYGRTVSKDLTWSAPVWYDPANADPQLVIDDGSPTSTPTDTLAPTETSIPPTATDTPTPTNTSIPPTFTDTPTPTNTPTMTPTHGPGLDHIVISEFRTRGPKGTTDEFVELYNPTGAAVNISGWLLKASSSTGVVGTRATIKTGTILQPGKHYLLANNGFRGTVSANQKYSTEVADNGGIALFNGTTLVDQVGMSAGSAYKEGTILTPLTTNADRSYERKLGGSAASCMDAGNNSADFQLISPSAPQNMASAAVFCP